MKKYSLILLGVVAFLFSVVFLRAAAFTSRQLPAEPIRTIPIDHAAVVGRLAQAIRFKTVSQPLPEQSAAPEFAKLRAFLAKSFPRLDRRLHKEIIGGQSLLYTWEGKDKRLKPILLIAHTDVVPVDPATESLWHHPPFAGEVADGYVWGRGAMDDKASVLAILEAVEYLLGTSFQPRRTIYLAFGHDEELGGANGAAKIAALLNARHVELEAILDEGLNIFVAVIPGVSPPVALVGIAEKGYLSLRLNVETSSGHSSTPAERTAIGILTEALQRLRAKPFPARLNGPTRELFEFLGPEMAWNKKLILANLWLFAPLLERQLEESPLTNALLRTTVAPTMIQAGIQDNMLPLKATAVVNLRILPGESTASAMEYVRRMIADPAVKIESLPIQTEPSAVSNIDSASFLWLQRTIGQTAPAALVAPALLVASTDSQHYRGLSRNIFRFFPVIARTDDIKRYHGVDERIAIDDYERCIRFYVQLIINSDTDLRQ